VSRLAAPLAVQDGFTLIEVLLTVTILSLIIGVLTDTLILGGRDVAASVAATPGGTACGVNNAALVTTEQSSATLAAPDRAVAYSVGAGGLTRATCAVGASTAATTAVVADDVTAFAATCAAPGSCGTVHLAVQTAPGTNTPAYDFTLDVTRRQ